MSPATACRDWLRALGHTAAAGGPRTASGTEIVCHDITATDERSDADELTHPRVQFDVWGDSYSDAWDEAKWLRSQLRALRGTTTFAAGTDCLGLSALDGPGFQPDPQADRPRFVLTAALALRST